MRYFSQLARETTARVMPSRQPPWLRPISGVAEETTVEWPATRAVAPNPAVSRSVPPPETGGIARAASRLGTAQEPPRPGAIMQAIQISVPTPAAEEGRERAQPALALPPAREAGRGDASPAAYSPAWPISTSGEERAPQALPVGAPSPQQTEVSAAREREPMPATLQGVISELTRRQQELEERYQANQIVARNAPTRTEADRVDAQTVRADEGVLLNIGSIVVQVEPERVAPTTPSRPSPRRVPRGNRNDWKRSFLDR